MTQDLHQDTNASGQISFLDQARLRPQQPTKYNDLIINTLIKLKNSGRCDSTIKATSYSLKQLSQHADLGNPEQVNPHRKRKDIQRNKNKTMPSIQQLLQNQRNPMGKTPLQMGTQNPPNTNHRSSKQNNSRMWP